MKILIAGAGTVGRNLAQQFSLEGHDVSVVERQPAVVAKLAEKMDILAVAGSCTSPSVLEEAGIQSCDMLIAVTNIDEVNMITCLLAGKYGVGRKIARVRNEQIVGKHGKIDAADLHIDLAIDPDQITVDKIVTILRLPGAVDTAEFAGGQVVLRGLDVPDDAPIKGTTVDAVFGASPARFPLAVALAKNDVLSVPEGSETIEPGDRLYVIGTPESVEELGALLRPEAGPVRKIVIYGATDSTVALASRLGDGAGGITIIEPDPAAAESAAEQMPDALVLEGEGTDAHILKEANIGFADFFIALSLNDQSNALAALLARRLGAKRTIVLANEPDYVSVLQSVGMDVVINPRLITAEAILRTIRRDKVVSVVQVAGGEAEAIELIVEMGADVIARELRERFFPKDALLGAIVRQGAPIAPDGDSVILPDDRLVIFTLATASDEIERLFSMDASAL